MSEAYIIDGLRTPIGAFGGSLARVRADDMAAFVIKTLMARNSSIEPKYISDVVFGCANQAGEDNRNVARMAALLAGLPTTVPGETVNRLCASGLSAVANAARAIKVQEGDIYIAGGVEQMTRAPFVMAKADSAFSRKVEMYDTSLGWRFINPAMQKQYGVDAMGETAENLAEKYGIERGDQDLYAFNSQQKAATAQKRDFFKAEIAPIPVPQPKGDMALFDRDEFIRPQTTIDILAKLKPAFRHDGKGSVTAGNSSGINDGACALLLASENAVRALNLKPRARVVTAAAVGCEPRIMGIGPVEATHLALQRAGVALVDMSVIELNEAFAAQCLACMRELRLDDTDPRVNPNGGAIALGHPLGMSGARLVLSALHTLERQNGRFAICTMCVGVGQGMACIIEKL